MIRIGMTALFALMGIAVFIYKRRQERIGPQEARLRTGLVRVPVQIATHKRPKIQGAWAIWLALPFGLIAIGFWYYAKISDGYAAMILMDRGTEIRASVVTGGLPRDDCTYQFEVSDQRYLGRGPESLERGATLTVKYDPVDPRRNRPASGLIKDIVGAAFVTFALAGILLLVFIPRPKLRYREQQLAQRIGALIAAGDFDMAVADFEQMDHRTKKVMRLTLANAITGKACVSGDPQGYGRAATALDRIAETTSDPSERRELVAYMGELDASYRLWKEHLARQPGQGVESGSDFSPGP